MQCCYMALLGKALKTGATISARMPACIGQQHWSRGRGGIRCDVTTCRRMAAFFWRTRGKFFGLWMCKHELEQIPFCICQKPNPNILSSSQLLQQRSNIAAFAPHVGKNWRSYAACLAWCTNVECASTPPEAALQRSADDNRREHKHRVLHSARTMHAQCTRQCTPQCTATKRCKYHLFSQRIIKKTKKKTMFCVYCFNSKKC